MTFVREQRGRKSGSAVVCLGLALAVAVSGVVPLGRSCREGGECICPSRRVSHVPAAPEETVVPAPEGACGGGCCGAAKRGEPDRPARPRDACGSCSWCPLLSVVERDRDMPARSDDGPRCDGRIPLTPILTAQLPMPCSLASGPAVSQDGRPPPDALSGGLFDLHCSLLI